MLARAALAFALVAGIAPAALAQSADVCVTLPGGGSSDPFCVGTSAVDGAASQPLRSVGACADPANKGDGKAFQNCGKGISDAACASKGGVMERVTGSKLCKGVAEINACFEMEALHGDAFTSCVESAGENFCPDFDKTAQMREAREKVGVEGKFCPFGKNATTPQLPADDVDWRDPESRARHVVSVAKTYGDKALALGAKARDSFVHAVDWIRSQLPSR